MQDEQKVQELAFRRLLRSGWEGSEKYIFGGHTLISRRFQGRGKGIFKTPSIGFIYILMRVKQKRKIILKNRLTDDDIAEFAYWHI